MKKKKLSYIIEYFKEGKILSLISDAGTPVLSDPGNLIINECIKNDIKIYTVPGPSAVSAAVSMSGFGEKFLFYGFLPKTENELSKLLKSLDSESYSLVFFVPAIKINFYIKQFKKYFSDREIFIAREMTKKYETYYRASINKMNIFKTQLKGELTIVISENNNKTQIFDQEKIVNKIKKYLKKYSLKDTVNIILETEKINKKKNL